MFKWILTTKICWIRDPTYTTIRDIWFWAQISAIFYRGKLAQFSFVAGSIGQVVLSISYNVLYLWILPNASRGACKYTLNEGHLQTPCMRVTAWLRTFESVECDVTKTLYSCLSVCQAIPLHQGYGWSANPLKYLAYPYVYISECFNDSLTGK